MARNQPDLFGPDPQADLFGTGHVRVLTHRVSTDDQLAA